MHFICQFVNVPLSNVRLVHVSILFNFSMKGHRWRGVCGYVELYLGSGFVVCIIKDRVCVDG